MITVFVKGHVFKYNSVIDYIAYHYTACKNNCSLIRNDGKVAIYKYSYEEFPQHSFGIQHIPNCKDLKLQRLL